MPVFAWSLIAAAILFVWQMIPAIGFVLMFLGGPLWTALLIAIALVAMAIEALMRRISRWFLVIPLSAVAGYYGLMAYEWQRLPTIPAEMGLAPVSPQLRFDPARHAIGPNVGSPIYLLAAYDIEQVYDHNFDSRWTIGNTRSCELRSRLGSDEYVPGTPMGLQVQGLDKIFCVTREADVLPPANGRIVAERRDSKPVYSGVEVLLEELVISLDDREVGSIANVKAGVLLPVPIFGVSCGLNGGPSSWGCGVTFMRSEIEVWPDFGQRRDYSADDEERRRETDEIATLLGLTPRTPAEIEAITRIQ
jgi:hypothetical protein